MTETRKHNNPEVLLPMRVHNFLMTSKTEFNTTTLLLLLYNSRLLNTFLELTPARFTTIYTCKFDIVSK